MRKKKKNFLVGLLTLILAFFAKDIVKDNFINTNTNTYTAYVERVVDGDTLKIRFDNKIERARLIGIDTPESVHPDPSKNTYFGKIASNYTKSRLEKREIQVEFDKEPKDKYGRLLVYVYIDGEMFNKTLLKEGYATVLTVRPNIKHENEFIILENEARKNRVGIWK